MRVLVACEFSGRVRDAFARRGHDAWSCDIRPGARWNHAEWREEAQLAALHFVKALWKFPVARVAIENPVGRLSSLWRGPTQTIQPWMFGDDETKATCLWLRGLPPLLPLIGKKPANVAASTWREPPGPDRKKNRSRTYHGIAAAFAEQWGGVSQSIAA